MGRVGVATRRRTWPGVRRSRRTGAGDSRRGDAPLDRAGGWAPNAQIAFAYAVEIAWHLEDAGYVPALERNVREKWLDPDLAYPEVDARWSYAFVCALDGRADDARHWFAEARRVLAERESEPLIVGVDFHAAEVELRLAPTATQEFANASPRPDAGVSTPRWRPGSRAWTNSRLKAPGASPSKWIRQW